MNLLKIFSLALVLALTFASTTQAVHVQFNKTTGIVEKVGDKFFFTDDKGDRYEFKKYDEKEKRGYYIDKEGNTFAVDPEGGINQVFL